MCSSDLVDLDLTNTTAAISLNSDLAQCTSRPRVQYAFSSPPQVNLQVPLALLNLSNSLTHVNIYSNADIDVLDVSYSTFNLFSSTGSNARIQDFIARGSSPSPLATASLPSNYQVDRLVWTGAQGLIDFTPPPGVTQQSPQLVNLSGSDVRTIKFTQNLPITLDVSGCINLDTFEFTNQGGIDGISELFIEDIVNGVENLEVLLSANSLHTLHARNSGITLDDMAKAIGSRTPPVSTLICPFPLILLQSLLTLVQRSMSHRIDSQEGSI